MRKFNYLKNTKQLDNHYKNLKADKEKRIEREKPKQVLAIKSKPKIKQEIKIEVKPDKILKIIEPKKLNIWQKAKNILLKKII